MKLRKTRVLNRENGPAKALNWTLMGLDGGESKKHCPEPMREELYELTKESMVCI